MKERDQEGYRTLGWIINKSEQGLFLVIADEKMQAEIAAIYRRGAVEIYDYRRHPAEYAFRDLQEWVTGLPETKVFMVVNFHLALQSEQSLKRLNFSRDMLEDLGKNLIFLVTPYGDDQLAAAACDFYCFVKLKVTFAEHWQAGELSAVADNSVEEGGEDESPKQKMARANALVGQARDALQNADYDASERLLVYAREIKGQLLGAEQLELAQLDFELADVYYKQGRFQEAEALYEKSLRVREKILGEEHPQAAFVYNNLAVLYKEQGKYRQAEEFYRKSMRICEKALGEQHLYTAMAYNNLAELYHSQGRYRHAKALYEKSLSIRRKMLGEEHPDTAQSYHNLAILYEEQGKYQEAEALYGKSLQIMERVLGEEHPHTAKGYHNLAALYEDQGKYREAEELYQKSLQIEKRVLGEEHPDTARGYHNLAVFYKKQGKSRKAEELYGKSLQIMKHVLGEEHPDTTLGYINLAGLPLVNTHMGILPISFSLGTP